MGQLNCLKTLNLSYCRQLEVISPNILSNLKKLEELYMRGSFDRWEAEGLNEGKQRAGLDDAKDDGYDNFYESASNKNAVGYNGKSDSTWTGGGFL